MSTQSQPESDPETVYQRTLRTIAYQTTPKQPPGARPGTIRLILCNHGSLEAESVSKALRRAETNDDILVWRDVEGQPRVTLTTESDLRRLLGHFNEIDADVQACERVATAIREVRDA